MDGIPFFSQGKSIFQLMCLQPRRAWETQNNFSRQCPVVSQFRSAIELLVVDDDSAWETQKECFRFCGDMVDGIPVVGHAKGAIHYVCGDLEGGLSAMRASSHSTAVVGGGVLGVFVGGPAGAIMGGIAAGAAMDTTITIADTAVNGMVDGKPRMYGVLEPFSDPTDADKWFDAICGLALDGIGGRSAGQRASRMALARTMLPTHVRVLPNMTVFMMVRNECFYLFREKGRGNAKNNIMKDLLTDVGPMTVDFCGQVIGIFFRDGDVFYKYGNNNERKLKKNWVYTVDVGGIIQDVLDYLKHCTGDGNSGKKNKWTGFWENPKRVALLRNFLEHVAKKIS